MDNCTNPSLLLKTTVQLGAGFWRRDSGLSELGVSHCPYLGGTGLGIYMVLPGSKADKLDSSESSENQTLLRPEIYG